MKRKLIILTALVLSLPVSAETTCETLGRFAGFAMTQYQQGVSYVEIYRNVAHIPMALMIVDDAYSKRRHYTDHGRETAVLQFEQMHFKACMAAKVK